MNARDYLNEDFDTELRVRTPDAAGPSKPSSGRRTFNKKRSASPKQFNGIHRRRKKKIRW